MVDVFLSCLEELQLLDGNVYKTHTTILALSS